MLLWKPPIRWKTSSGQLAQSIKVLAIDMVASLQPFITELGKVGTTLQGWLNDITAWEKKQAEHPLINLFVKGVCSAPR